MVLVIVTTNKTNAQILQILEDIESGKKGKLASYEECIFRHATGDVEFSSFTKMKQEAINTHMNGYNIAT